MIAKTVTFTTLALSFTLLTAIEVNAQSSTALELEEVVVTAQKREESLQDIPVSVIAIGEQELEFHRLGQSNDLSKIVPGLVINGPYTDTNAKLTMRGLGTRDFTQTYQATVGYYVDEMFLGSPVGSVLGLFDLDRIEVLRGPQGTLYGRNTTGGAINFISRKPGTEFGLNGHLTYGNFDTFEAEVGVDIPLSETLLTRVALKSRTRGEGNTASRNQGLRIYDVTANKEQYDAGRVQLKWLPTDTFSALFILDALFNDSDGLRGQQVNPRGPGGGDILGFRDTDGDNFAGEYGFPSRSKDEIDMWNANLQLEWDLSWGELKSITAFHTFDSFRGEEGDATKAITFEPEVETDYEQFTQELRLHSTFKDKLDWIIGAYYYTDDLSGNNYAYFTDSFGAFATNWRPLQEVESYALFFHGELSITDRLDAFGGVRWTHEKREYDYFARDVAVDASNRPLVDQVLFTYVPPSSREDSWKAWTGEAGLTFHVSEDFMIYGKYSRGFRSGGYDGLIFNPAELDAYDPEFIDAFEIGAKSTMFNGRVRANISMYYYEGTDMQQLTEIPDPTNPTGSVVAIANAAEAEVMGMDLEVLARPTEGLELSLGLSLLDTEITNFESFGQTDLTGDELYSAPHVTGNSRLSYTYPLRNGAILESGINLSYTGNMYFDPDNDLVEQIRPGSYYLVDARLQYNEPKGRYYIALWSKNLLDEEYVTYANRLDVSSMDVEFYGMPRTFGAEVGFSY